MVEFFARSLRYLGMELAGQVVVGGLAAKGQVLGREDALQAAFRLGRELAGRRGTMNGGNDMLQVTAGWRETHPGACVGLLAVDKVSNPEYDERLEAHKGELERALKERYRTRDDLLALEHVRVYRDYYRRFGKTYFVLLQMESVAVKGRPFPREAALVEAMFMAEVKNGLLTAGHDMASLAGQLVLDAAADGEGYTGISGREQATKAGDMLMRDREGVISSVVLGPDFRTRLTAATTRSLFVVYAPPGVAQGLVERHLEDILANVRLFAPTATPAGGGIFR